MTMSDGIKVFFTTETPGEVRIWVGGGIKFRTERAEEAEIAFGVFMRYGEDISDESMMGGYRFVMSARVEGKRRRAMVDLLKRLNFSKSLMEDILGNFL